VSESVLDAPARALQLDEAERVHLGDLARAAGPAARIRRKPPVQRIRPSLLRILEGMTEVPAIVNNGSLSAVAANTLGRRFSRACSPTPPGRSTMLGSPSSTPAPMTSGSTENGPPTTPWPRCAWKPAATPTTRG
jgi:hypothetical protein